jgi:hypothetical protein
MTRSMPGNARCGLLYHVNFPEEKVKSTIMNKPVSLIRLTAMLVCGFVLLGCETAPPMIQTGPDAELSFDGLHNVDNSQAAA